MKNLLVAFLIIIPILSVAQQRHKEITYHCTVTKKWKEVKPDYPNDTIYNLQFKAAETGTLYTFTVVQNGLDSGIVKVLLKNGEKILFSTVDPHSPLSRPDAYKDENGIYSVRLMMDNYGDNMNFKSYQGYFKPLTLSLLDATNTTVYTFEF